MKKLFFGILALTLMTNLCFSQDFDFFGQEHNRMLKVVLQNYDNTVNKSNIYEKTVAIMQRNFKDYKNLEVYSFSNYISPNNMVDELLKKNAISKSLYDIVNKDIANTINMTNTKSISIYVEGARNIKLNLSENEKTLYLNFLSTLKHSSVFWDPNGENGRSYISINPKSKTPESTPTTASKLSWQAKYWLCHGVGALCGGPWGALGCSACFAIGEL